MCLVPSNDIIAYLKDEGFIENPKYSFNKSIGSQDFSIYFHYEITPMLFSFETFLNDESIGKDFSKVIIKDVNDVKLFIGRAFYYNLAINNI